MDSQVTIDPLALVDENIAASFLGVTPRALQKWRFLGNGPSFVRISRRAIRYRRQDLIQWSENLIRTSTSDPRNKKGDAA